MPFTTRYYNLEAFTIGDTYSSKVDQKRFTIIDNQMAFLADQIGSGLITGWDITDNGDGTISISDGMGMINRKVVQSFGGFDVTLSNNTVHYLSMEAKDGVVGGTSGNSNMVSVTAIDIVPPSSPSGLAIENSVLSYLSSLSSVSNDLLNYLRNIMGRKNEEDSLELVRHKELAFTWEQNQEPDFSYYSIRKASELEYDVFEEVATTTNLIYVDVELSEDTSYDYQVVAVDLSGNESSPSEITVATEGNDSPPSPPIFIQVFPGDQSLEVIWDHSPSDGVIKYRVVLQPLDKEYNADGDPTTVDVDAESSSEFGSTYAIFENLENNKSYDITVYAVSRSGSLSDGISTRTILSSSLGPEEVTNIDAEFSISTFQNVGLETKVLWNYENIDPYKPFTYKFMITFIENGTRSSETIEILESIANFGDHYEIDVKYIPYEVAGIIEYESIKEYTPYIILVQAVDENGNTNNGVVIRVARTPVTQPVASITDFSIERQTNNEIYMSWTNPTEEYFSYNRITVNILDLTTTDSDGTDYVDNLRIGKSTNYIIPSSQFGVDYRYTITISPYDVFGTDEVDGAGGISFTITQQFSDAEEILRPSPPTGLKLEVGDTEINLRWNKNEIGDYIEFYRIYRSQFSLYQRTTDYEILNTIPSTLISFTDYTVTNGIAYSYFITSIDIHGIESLNPVDDGHVSPNAVSGTPSSSTTLDPPENLVINQDISDFDNADVYLSWDSGAGVFDGYEILKSSGNNYSFVSIDNVPISQTTYIDSNALLKNGETYYYLVRKYRSEVNLNVKFTSDLSENSISIGVVTTTGGTSTVSIDLTSVVNIENLQYPLTTLTNASIDVHHHTNDTEEGGVDKRIELRSNVNVTDWETLDYKEYSTEEDIEGATSYFLQISGTLNEDYFKDSDGNVNTPLLRQAQAGESSILFKIDSDNGKIIFQDPIYSPVGSFTAPYSTEPSLSLELVGISEVDGLLPDSKTGDMSASQFESGRLDAVQMPSVNHEGRKSERLIPLLLPMKTVDNFVYSLAATYEDADRNLMGSAAAFYDVILTSGERLLAATSNGIWGSEDYGNNWVQNATFPVAVHKLYKSVSGDYYALTNYGVYKNDGTSFKTWNLMNGLEGVKSIRDITEDGSGNLYISTDLGVFKLNSEFIPYIEDTWQKMSIFGARSSESYAIIYDGAYSSSESVDGRILISNELGLVQSVDQGLTWNYISDLEAFVKIRDFKIDNGFIFALADNAIYRQQIGDDIFYDIVELNSSITKDMEIFNSQIYVTTDNGVYVTTATNIYTDEVIATVSTFSLINRKNVTVVATTINSVNDDLLVGSDSALYVVDENNNAWLQFEEAEKVIPTIYVDGVAQNLGFYYNNSGTEQNISFDEIVDNESEVYVANKYDIYNTEFGGWAHNNYDAKFVVYNNELQFGESRDNITLNINQFATVILPTYDDNNAHKLGADKYKETLQANLDIITGADIPSGDDLVVLISDTYQKFELFLSQLYEEARVITNDDGTTSPFSLPSIPTDIIVKRTVISNANEVTQVEEPVYTQINAERGTSYTTSVNVVDGFFVFGLPFSRYDSLTVDIFDVTVKNIGDNSHRELEDIFEEAYSGPPSYLSSVQQVNLVKLGLFNERMWPGEQYLTVPLVQAKNVLPVGDDWYDTLNSTINYEKEKYEEDVSLEILYPSAVAYISSMGKVLVGGKGGVLSIDKNNLDIEEVNFGSIGNDMVRDIYEEGDNVYILTDSNIFVTYNYGESWGEFNRSGLPNNLYAIGSISSSLIIGAEDGIYIKLSDSESVDWEKVQDSNSPVEVMHSSNIFFVVIDGKINISSNGFNYSDTGIGEDLDITDIDRHGFAITYVSTNQGLYTDSGTFNSLSPTLEEVSLGGLIEDNDTINDTTTDDLNKVVIAASNGSYGLIENSVLNIKENTSMSSIHKVLIVNDDEWLFGHGLFKVPYLDYPIKLSTGTPM